MNLEDEIKSVQIDKAKIKDVVDILIIEKECGLAKWKSEDYCEEIDREDSLVLIAKTKNKTIGFLAARSTTEETDIFNIGVSPKYQKLGIGGSLLNNLLERVRKTLVKSIWLEVRESNLEAIGFYRKKGFRQIQIRKNFYAQPVENAIVMKRELRNSIPKS